MRLRSHAIAEVMLVVAPVERVVKSAAVGDDRSAGVVEVVMDAVEA